MPVTFFAPAGANPCVLPKHLLDKYETINDVPYNSLPVGIGPFRYKAFDRADKVELEANPYYFRGMPKLKEVIYKIIPDRNTVTTQLQTHELDLWALVTANFYDRIKAFSGITVVREPSYQFDHMDFNLTHADVADPAVREALRYALNREEIRVKIRHGLGALSENVFPPNHQAYHAIPLVPFDLAKARKILDDAGWKPGPDGIRQKNGVRLMLDFASPTGTPDTDSELELIRQNWKKIGVDFTVHHFLSSLFFAPASDGGILYGGKFDAIMFAWSTDSFGDLSTIYGCESFPPNGENAAHWCDHTAQAAMDQFKVEYDPAKRNPYDWIVTDRIVKDVPTIVMDTRENIFAYNSDLKNWHPNATAPFDDMMNVDI
jgi:peptide/nickel transport system substrate-binding protein